MNKLSHQLQLWRASRGLSQKELAGRAHIPRPNLISLELGRRDCTVVTLQRLATALGIRTGQLLDEKPPQLTASLGRFERDALARALITGTEPSLPGLKRYFRNLRPLFRPSLEAIGKWTSAKKGCFVRRRKFRLETLYSPEFLKDINDRVQRLLPAFIEAGHD